MISNCGSDERHKYHGGSAGDQTGTEYRVINWYNRPWNYVLRPKSRTVGNKLAQIARQAAENNNIGYDQYQRLTYFDALSKADWNPSKITTKCETDCTASTAANVIATGYQLGIKPLEEVSPKLYSGNIRRGLMTTGEFETLTASKYLTSDKYLLPGDILLYENHHAAINLSNGSSNDLPSSSSSSSSAKPSISDTAKNVLNGKYGNGQDRIDRLKKLGYTDAEIKEIQAKVNEMLKPASKPTPKPTPTPTPKPSNAIAVDGEWGKGTTRAAQKVFHTYQDGIVSKQIAKYRKYMPNCLTSSWKFLSSGYKGGSDLIRAIQKWCGADVDGLCGQGTIKALQRKLGVSADGIMGKNTVSAFQRYLNKYL